MPGKTIRSIAIGAAIAAMAPLSWWVGGLPPDQVTAASDPDYMFHPVDLATGVEPAIGVVSLVIVAAVVRLLIVSARRGTRFDRWRVFIPLAAISAYAGLTYRTVTMPVIGANIGGGLMILGAVPFTVALLTLAFIAERNVRRPASSRTSGEPRPQT